MEHPQQINNETKHQIFCIAKEIEANEHKLKVFRAEREKLPKSEAELESNTYKQRTCTEKQCEGSLERKLEILERDRDEVLSRFEEQKIILEQAGEWMKILQDFKGKYFAAQKEKVEVVQQRDALQIQLKLALAERDELKSSNEEMSCHVKLLEKQLKVVESDKAKLKGEVVHAKKRSAKQEELIIKVKRSRTNLYEQLEASERNLKKSEAENNLLNENIRLLKQQVSLMQNAYEPQQLKSETVVHDLPLELLDMILQKSYLFCSMDTHGSTQPRDKAIVRKVASVDFCWFHRTMKPRFKRTIWRHLKVFYRNIGARHTICRSNRSYLQQVIGSSDITTCLKSIEYPSDVQARQRKSWNSHTLQHANSEPPNRISEEARVHHKAFVYYTARYKDMMTRELRKKNSEVEFLSDIRFLDEARYSSMINCLRQAKLMNCARLAENGGVAVKVEVIHVDDIRFSERLVKGLNDLKDNTRLRHVEGMIKDLKSDDIEILDSFHQRRHADVWIWCKSQTGLASLQELYRSCYLTYVLASLSNMDSYVLGFECSIDKDPFKKEIVSLSLAIKFDQELDLKGRERYHIVGVAKLPGKILVISLSSQTVVQVFQDDNPFCLLKSTEHSEILWPVDIVSCERQQCVYIIDKESKCVWKITSKTDDSYEVTKWCNASSPYTMSTCNDGQLVTIRNDGWRPVLMIHSSTAVLLRSIVLPSHIQNPRHAVITSTGNFVILHDFTNEGSKSEIRLSELTRHGLDVLHSFVPENKEQCLGVPYQLLLDSDDRVIIADHWNSRMILLNSDLTWNQSCIIKHETGEKQRPKSIHYDEKNKQLIVAGNVSLLKGGVNVYALSWKINTDD